MNQLPNLVIIKLFTTKGIRSSADMKALLDILEFFPEFTPQKWGKDGKPKRAYARDEMIASFLTPDGGNLFFRNQKPKYEGFFPTSISGKLTYFDLDVKLETEQDVQRVFELGNSLAKFFEPIYGSVHPIWESDKPEYKKYSIPGITPLIYSHHSRYFHKQALKFEKPFKMGFTLQECGKMETPVNACRGWL